MKKIFATLALSLFTASTMAWELGVSGGRDFSNTNRNYLGVTLGHPVGPVSLTAGYHRSVLGDNDQNRFSVVAGYDVAKFGPLTVTPNLGVAYLNNQTTSNGFAVTAGVEASMPVINKVDVVADWSYQIGQNRVNASNGNRISLGLRYAF